MIIPRLFDDQVVAVFGICGAMRCKEISEIRVNDMKKEGRIFVVHVEKTKTKIKVRWASRPIPENETDESKEGELLLQLSKGESSGASSWCESILQISRENSDVPPNTKCEGVHW